MNRKALGGAGVLLGLVVAAVAAHKAGVEKRKLRPFTATELPPTERFSCLLPKNTKKRTWTEAQSQGGVATGTTFEIEFTDRSYSATAMVYPERFGHVPVDVVYDALTNMLKDTRENEDLRDCVFVGARPCTVGGKEGREVDLAGVSKKTGKKHLTRARFVFVKHRLFAVELAAATQALLDSAESRQFLDSLRVPVAD